MTITTTANSVSYIGNSATTVWPFAFLIPAQADIQVSLVDKTSGNETVLSPTVYTVSGFGAPAGGSVTYPLSGSPLTSSTYLVIQRLLPLEQQTTFLNQGAAYPQDIESALDYLTMICQQLQNALNRAIIFSAADSVEQALPTATARANLLLGFDSSGNPIAIAGINPSVTVSSAMVPVVTAPSTAAALTALGIPGSLLDQLIPAGTIWDYSLTSAPTGFVFPSGQACTSLYPTYRAALVAASSPFGSNGTDPLMPDCRSVVSAGKSNMNGADNGLLTGGTVLGAILGAQLKTLLTTNFPPYTPGGTIATVAGSANDNVLVNGNAAGSLGAGAAGFGWANAPTLKTLQAAIGTISSTWTGTPQGGTSTPFSIVQPTIVLNKIVKVH